MTDDPDKPSNPASGDLASPFLFVPHGAPEPVGWMRKHPGWVKFPATFVPRAPAVVRTIPGTNRPWPLDKRGQPWPRSRFGQPLRPLDEYPPGVRAPGEGYTGPIADPGEAMRAALSSKDVLAQAAKHAADPDAPIRAYLSAMEVWRNPRKYGIGLDVPVRAYPSGRRGRENPSEHASDPRPDATLAPVRDPPRAERGADAMWAGMDRLHTAGVSEASQTEQGDVRGDLRDRLGVGQAGPGVFNDPSADEQRRHIAEVGSGLLAGRAAAGVQPWMLFAGSWGNGLTAVHPSGIMDVADRFTSDPRDAARGLGMTHGEFRRAIHLLKDAAGLRGNENLRFHIPSGEVYFGDEYVGNLRDE